MLLEHDMDTRPELSPWLDRVWVYASMAEEYRFFHPYCFVARIGRGYTAPRDPDKESGSK